MMPPATITMYFLVRLTPYFNDSCVHGASEIFFLNQVFIYLLPFCESKEDFLSLEALMSEEMVQK